MEHARRRGSALDAPAQMIRDKLSAGILPREEASQTFAGYGTGSPCAGCDLAIHPTDVEHEMVFADKRSFAFHLACVTLWHSLKDAPADGAWHVTCSCKGRIGFADTFAAAEVLGREHVAARRNSIRKGRHIITLALEGPAGRASSAGGQ
jgi:hypothetical protein